MFGGRDEDEGGHPIVGLLGILVAPLAATLIQMAISRRGSFWRTSMGHTSSGNPLALASALA